MTAREVRMAPAMIVALLWILSAGSHIGLGVYRERLVRRLGPIGFTALFYVVAAVSFAALVTSYAAQRFDGLPGIGLDASAVRWPLMAIAVLGLALCVPGLRSYGRMPSALFDQPVRAVRGIERVTRHPFFAGMALFAAAHVLLATRLVGTAFFAGLFLLATVGAWHQDRKLRARRGPVYASYLTATSAVPFVAVVAGRQPFVWRELPVAAFGIGVLLALAARAWHGALFAGGGWWIVAGVVGGGSIAGVNAWRRARRLHGDRDDRTDVVLPVHVSHAGGKS